MSHVSVQLTGRTLPRPRSLGTSDSSCLRLSCRGWAHHKMMKLIAHMLHLQTVRTWMDYSGSSIIEHSSPSSVSWRRCTNLRAASTSSASLTYVFNVMSCSNFIVKHNEGLDSGEGWEGSLLNLEIIVSQTQISSVGLEILWTSSTGCFQQFTRARRGIQTQNIWLLPFIFMIFFFFFAKRSTSS